MSDNYMLNGKLSDILRSLWNLNDNVKTLSGNIKKNSNSEKELLVVMNEILKSNQRIEQNISELAELKKYELGLPNKFNANDNKNIASSTKTFGKKRI